MVGLDGEAMWSKLSNAKEPIGVDRKHYSGDPLGMEIEEKSRILAREIEINKNCFIFDKDGHPRFVEKILGITKDMGPIEFVVKFKYLRKGTH